MIRFKKKTASQTQEVQEACPKKDTSARRREKKNRRPADLLMAAAVPEKRAAMTKVWIRRRKRLGHVSTAVRLVIRYLNARERTTIYRNK